MSTPKPAPDRASRLALARKLTEALLVLDGPGSGSLPVSLGCDALSSFLPGAGLGREALHEVAPDSASDGPAALGFLAALMARGLEGPKDRRSS